MFFKYFREKIFMKKFQNFSTNQIAGFWNLEFGAKIDISIKRVIFWFQNCTPNKNRFFGSREIAFENFGKSDFCNFFLEKIDFLENKKLNFPERTICARISRENSSCNYQDIVGDFPAFFLLFPKFIDADIKLGTIEIWLWNFGSGIFRFCVILKVSRILICMCFAFRLNFWSLYALAPSNQLVRNFLFISTLCILVVFIKMWELTKAAYPSATTRRRLKNYFINVSNDWNRTISDKSYAKRVEIVSIKFLKYSLK